MSSLLSKKKSAKLFSYGNIPLRLYFDIIASGDWRLLLISGEATDKQLQRAWETIVRMNEKQCGTLWYYRHLDDLTVIKETLVEYISVTAMLNKLLYKIDWNYIKELKHLGYQLDTSSNGSFKKSLEDCLQSVKGLVTQFQIQKRKMELENKNSKDSTPSFDSTMARLSMSLGFTLPDDITLVRFNEYNKLLRQRAVKAKPLNDDDNG